MESIQNKYYENVLDLTETVKSFFLMVLINFAYGETWMEYLIRFEDNKAIDPSVVGHKFASLARTARSGFNVPMAFAIRVEAHRFYRQKKTLSQNRSHKLVQ